jgi:hypothetical protein
LLPASSPLNLSVRPSGQEANRHARHASTQAPNQRVSKPWNAACDWERKALRFLLHDQHRIDGASFGQGVRNLLPELARRFVSGHDMRLIRRLNARWLASITFMSGRITRRIEFLRPTGSHSARSRQKAA